MAQTFSSAEVVGSHLKRFPVRHLVAGELQGSERSFGVINPATGEVAAQCPEASREQLDEAVRLARLAQPSWAATPIAVRREALLEFARRMVEHEEELAGIITLEQGKPLGAALAEVRRAAQVLGQVVSISLDDEVLRDDANGRVELRYRPLGVVGAIAPWNMPIVLSVPKITHALYTGNALVLKPSPYTPLATLRLGEIAADLFPAGVISILAGFDKLGQGMSEHAGIDKISFTGSIATGKKVMASAAVNLKRLTLELGGNDAAIVLEDADVAAIAQRLFDGAFVNSGQVCMAIKRLYVHESLYDAACEALTRIAAAVRVGDGFNPKTQLGPVQNKAQFEIVKGVLQDTQATPAVRILTGGRPIEGPGYFVPPTLVADIAEGTRLVDEEPFGPVLPIIRYKEVADAVQRANRTSYGLGASVWGRNTRRATEVAGQLEAGMVWVNRHVGADPTVPFGGAKQSGIGREYGIHGLRAYMEAMSLFMPPSVR